MGIKNLLKFISDSPELIKPIKKESFKSKRVAIDISILIYKIIISVRNSGADFTNQEGKITSHILGLFNKTIELLDIGIIPVYVFDGKPPSIKDDTIEGRKEIKRKALEKYEQATTKEDKIKYFKRSTSISKEQWEQCRELLQIMGIPYVMAPEEADSQCAYLAKNNLVDAVYTEDMDILTFGSPKIVRNLTSHKIETTEIILKDVLDKLELNHDQFIEFCILLGSDYLDGISDLKPLQIYNYFKINKNIKDTLILIKKDNYKIPKDFNYEEVKTYFVNPIVTEVKKEDLMLFQPDCNKLLKKLVNEYGLIKFLIKNKLEKLDNAYNKLKQIN